MHLNLKKNTMTLGVSSSHLTCLRYPYLLIGMRMTPDVSVMLKRVCANEMTDHWMCSTLPVTMLGLLSIKSKVKLSLRAEMSFVRT